MVVTVRPVRIKDYVDQAAELLRANWAETGFDFELKPDFDRYQTLQDAGVLVVLAAFDGDTLVGYSTAVISPHLFNPTVICCASDALFVSPDYRQGSAAMRLISATEQTAKEHGAALMSWHTRSGTPLAAAFEKRGYAPADAVVTRRL